MSMRIALFSTTSYDKEYFDEANKRFHFDITHFEARLRKRTAHLAAGFNAVIVFVNDVLDRETIGILKEHGVSLIALRCAGFNNVDLTAAIDAEIKVVRVPAYSPEAVAEHALALILTLNRKTHKAYNRVREGNFSLERLTGFNLSGKTVGVIGTGKIGAAFSSIMSGMGCRVLAFDTYPNEALILSGLEYVSLEQLLYQSDIISLHCPLTPETTHLIDQKTLSMMKPGVMLINTSRGALVNTNDAITFLKNRHLGYLGIDVYEQEEKLFFRDRSEQILQDDEIARLMSFPNVLITAHQAFLTSEALEQIAATTLENLKSFIRNEELVNEVKPTANHNSVPND
ncbi:MAG: 2-hydroxyacid dehydrogenase [Bacteroidales bacterium]|nr:2-hydroxyacid dehydrogenase [Bacteroidales bacterium]